MCKGLPERYVEALISRTCDCDLVWKQGLSICTKVKLRSYWVRVGPAPVIDVLIRGKFGHRHTGDKGMRRWRPILE